MVFGWKIAVAGSLAKILRETLPIGWKRGGNCFHRLAPGDRKEIAGSTSSERERAARVKGEKKRSIYLTWKGSRPHGTCGGSPRQHERGTSRGSQEKGENMVPFNRPPGKGHNHSREQLRGGRTRGAFLIKGPLAVKKNACCNARREPVVWKSRTERKTTTGGR